MALTIRLAHADDALRLAHLNRHVQQLHHEAQPTRYKPVQSDDPALIGWYEEQLAREDVVISIAERDDQAVGYIVCVIRIQAETAFTYASRRIHIDQLAVDETYQREGIGTALFARAVELARVHQAERISLGVAAFNEQAIAFYRRQSFTNDHLSMELDLSGE